MRYNPKSLPVTAILALTLTGCATSGSVNLPPVPGDLRACFYKTVPKPESAKTRAEVFKLIADLKQSETRLSKCGHRLVNWYETQRTVYAQ
jgi:predicted small lipoprotein YifL